MLSSESKKLTIQATTDGANDAGDLLPFMSQISDLAFQEIKSVIRKDIDKMSGEHTNHIFYHLLSINTIFSGDLMQHILSFDLCNQSRAVCRRWNVVHKLNEALLLRDLDSDSLLIQKMARRIKRRLPIGSVVNIQSMKIEFERRNIPRVLVQKALEIMYHKKEIKFKAKRRQVYRSRT